jgi:predicted nucleotidyltransferase
VKLDDEILKSFSVKDELCPDIWETKGDTVKLKKIVRTKLLQIAELFREFVGIDFFVDDIVLMGSLVNYNWSKFSDADLHIVVDFNEFDQDKLDIYQELFEVKKKIFAQLHDITIYGFDVELYIQDKKIEAFSSGVYSVLNDEWVSFPKKEKIDVDKKLLKEKILQWVNIINGVEDIIKDLDYEEAIELIKSYKKKLKKYRTCGLENGGEFSYENIVFKYLRRSGHIGKLHNLQSKLEDKEMTLKENLKFY